MALFRIRPSYVLTVLTINFAIFAIIYSDEQATSAQQEVGRRMLPSLGNAIRKHFKLPKIFDFDNFKHLFNRHYNLVEEMTRRKLYLARAFDVFISVVKYKYRQSASYLGINDMSDYSEKELERMYMKMDNLKPSEEIREPEIQVSLADIEKELLEIERHKEEPGYKEIYEELKKASDVGREVEESIRKDKQKHFKPVESSETMVAPESQGGSLGVSFLRYVTTNAIDLFRDHERAREDRRRRQTGQDRVYASWKPYSREDSDVLEIDYRLLDDCYPPIQNQGQCGSCYVQQSLSLYEFLFCKKTGVLKKFSEQYIIDCGFHSQLRGCKGGKISRIPSFVSKFGFELAEHYPYKARDGICPFKPNDEDNDKRGFIKVEDKGLEAFSIRFLDIYLQRSPVLVNLVTNRYFSFYSNGVEMMNGCWSESNLRFHTMLVVGAGVDSEDGEYWLMRNSFGDSWGQDGHFKLNKKSKCIHTEYGFISKARFEYNYEDNLNPKYEPLPIREPSLWEKMTRS